MPKKLVKRIIIEIYEDGNSRIHEEDLSDIKLEYKVDENFIKDENIIREIYQTTTSWFKYGLITFSKKKKIYKELKDSKGESINVIFDGKEYSGVIGGDIARVHGLSSLMNEADKKGMFSEEQEVELIYDRKEKTLTIVMI